MVKVTVNYIALSLSSLLLLYRNKILLYCEANDEGIHRQLQGARQGLLSKGMPKSVAEAAMGDEWEDLTPPEIRTILSSEYLYLGLPQRELIWSKSPQ